MSGFWYYWMSLPECLGFFMARSIPASKVLTFLRGAVPEYLRSNNGHEFVEAALNAWLQEQGVRPTFITHLLSLFYPERVSMKAASSNISQVKSYSGLVILTGKDSRIFLFMDGAIVIISNTKSRLYANPRDGFLEDLRWSGRQDLNLRPIPPQ